MPGPANDGMMTSHRHKQWSDMGNPVEYAENTLGVNSTHEDLTFTVNQHQAASDRLVTAQQGIRHLEAELADRERDLLEEVWAAHNDQSGAEKERILKRTMGEDPEAKRIRGDLLDVRAEHDSAEADERHLRLRATALSSRLNELGGLLNFYAAAKRNANDANTATGEQQA